MDQHALVPGGRDAHRAVDANGLLRVPSEEVRGVGDLGSGVGQGLAVLTGDELGEFVGVVGHLLPHGAQQFAAIPRRRGRPVLLGRRGGVTGPGGIGGSAERDITDGLSCAGIDHVDAIAIGPRYPLPPDEQLRLHVGDLPQ